MDIYAFNKWDATLYAYGMTVSKLLYTSGIWKAMVVIFTVFAIGRIFLEMKRAISWEEVAKKIGAVFLFSAATLWPIPVVMNVYTISKESEYSNVFKWIIPIGRDKELTAELYGSGETALPFVIVATGEILSYLQFWTMWTVDKAGVLLGSGSVSSGQITLPGKIALFQSQISEGFSGIIADLKNAGEWSPEDQAKWAEVQDDLISFFKENCVSRETLATAWNEEVSRENPSGLVSFTSESPAISYFLENINKNLSAEKQEECRARAERIRNFTEEICQKWSEVRDNAPPEVCAGIFDGSMWQRFKWTLKGGAEKVKDIARGVVNLPFDIVKQFTIGTVISLSGLFAIFLLGIYVTIIPLILGVVNLLVFFLSPLFFLTQLVLFDYVSSTVRIILEMLWARLLYAVSVMAYAVTTLLEGAAWKAFLYTIAGGVGQSLNIASTEKIMQVLPERLASKSVALLVKGGGIGLLSMIFFNVAISVTAGLIVFFFGAKLLRTLIFAEALYLTDFFAAVRGNFTSYIDKFRKGIGNLYR